MKPIQTVVAVSGFSRHEIEPNLPFLIADLKKRDWFISVSANWKDDQNKIIIRIEEDSEDHSLEGIKDQVVDCVVANFNFSSDKISFEYTEII